VHAIIGIDSTGALEKVPQ